MQNKNGKKVIYAIFIFGMLLAACSKDKVPQVKHNNDPLWEVKLEGANPKFVEDYIYLWDLLESEYPMLAAAQRITGKDAQEVKERHYYTIPTCRDVDDFFYLVERCLGEFRGTGHLSAIDRGYYEMVYMNYKAGDEYTQSVPRSVYNFSQLTTKESLNFYQAEVEVAEAKIKAGGEEGIATVLPFNVPNNLSFNHYPERSAGYVAIQQMNIYMPNEINANAEHKALMAFFSELEDEGFENCIIDIRDNTGGATAYWYYSLVMPNLSESLTYDSLSLIRGDFCKYYMETLFGEWPVYPIGELDMGQLPGLNPEDTRDAIAYVLQCNEIAPVEAGKPVFSGKFYILVNEKVYSASEQFAIFCKQTGFATLVGTTTGGDGYGIDPALFALPNTGICIRFSASNGLNPDGSCNEEFGTEPDYFVAKGEDALEKCLNIIS